MKQLIAEEVQTFRSEVRALARANGQRRRQERYVFSLFNLNPFSDAQSATVFSYLLGMKF